MATFKSLQEKGRDMQRLGLQKEKPLFRDRILGKWQRKLIVGTILTSLFIGGAAVRSRAETVTIAKLNETNKKISAERYITYQGQTYKVRVEVPNRNVDCLDTWLDGRYGRITLPTTQFKEFAPLKIIIGNPSLMIVGVDEKGNYGFMIFDTLIGEYTLVPMISQLPAKRLAELGIRLEVKYDEEKKTWNTTYSDKDGKVISFEVFSEDGKKIKRVGSEDEEKWWKLLNTGQNN